MYFHRTHWMMALAALVSFVGCGKSGPDVNYVEGIVTLDGKPLEGVSVGFSPVDAKIGIPAVGNTDANGVFKLTAIQGGEPQGGTGEGEYYVSFTKSASTGVGMTYEDTQKMMEDPNYGQSGSSPGQTPKDLNVLPKAYLNPATSGVKVTVKSGKNTGDEFKFDLKSDYKGLTN